MPFGGSWHLLRWASRFLIRKTLSGVSKGEGPESLPFVSFGVWGESKRPSAFRRGSKGEVPFQKGIFPLSSMGMPTAGAE